MQKNPLLIFEQHGFKEISSSSGNQVIGYCPFCGGDKFFVNPEIKAWDCKHCLKEGGYQTFLQLINKHCQDAMLQDKLQFLSVNRGISPRILKLFGLGYNPITEKYTFPMYNVDRSELLNIYIFDPKTKNKAYKMIGSSGGNQGLIGWDLLRPTDEIIWLCEGHWDYLVMCEILDYFEIDNQVAVAVPGVGSLHDDWTVFFKDRIVNVLYDADSDRVVGGKTMNPANEGRLKVYNKLKRVCKELWFLEWPSNILDNKDKYDLRDLYNEADELFDSGDREENVLKYIKQRLVEVPPGIDITRFTDKKDVFDTSQKYKGTGITHTEVYERFAKWLKFRNNEVLDVFYGAIIANRLPAEPVWLFLVGPSGCGKSELMLSVKGAVGMYSIDSLTSHTLVSGSIGPGGSDPSLIPQIDGMVLGIKDLTTLLESNPKERDEVFGQLRSAFDGEYNKPFGTGILRAYDSKFGLIACVTRAIELYTETHTALGERFLRYHFPFNASTRGRQAVIAKALDNIRKHDKSVMKKEIKDIGHLILDYDYKDIPELNDEHAEKIVQIADWVSLMRGSVIRDTYSKEITHKAFMEIGTRLATQLGKLCLGIAMFKRKKEVTMEEIATIRNVATGSVPSRSEEIVRRIYKKDSDGNFDIEDLVDSMKLPLITLQRLVENLHMLNVVQKVKLTGLRSQWKLSNDLVSTMKGAGFYE